jgi:pyruvate/2-oxoglutarate dehydrogenase complex dihydrolipoamide acyltransferase (E2) component
MARDVLVPQMGESVLEGTILEWKVKVGDKVERDQPLVELMTDKVNVEIPSEAAGTLTQILAKEGDVVPVGTRIAVIDDGKGEPATGGTAGEKEPGAKSAGPEVVEEEVKETTARAAAEEKTAAKAKRPTGPIDRSKMSPKVKMLIREYDVDESLITPTGKDGRVTVDDVMEAVESRSAKAGFTGGPIPSPTPPPAPAAAAQPQPAAPEQPAEPKVKVEVPVFEPLPQSQREERVPIAGVRKMIAEHMVNSVRTSPHVTTFEDIDLTELVKYRSEVKADFRATYGANLTYMPFIFKAVCVALKEFPKLNASMAEREIIYKKYYNIGMAVAREEGLIVPVVRDADKKTIVELAVEMSQIGQKARENKLTPDDVSGGTFSVTNAGMFGATASTPIINQPQVAILGVHAIVKKPWVVDGEIKIRDISSFGLSFDHRLIDGHTAVQFLHRVHEYLADPRGLVLQLR